MTGADSPIVSRPARDGADGNHPGERLPGIRHVVAIGSGKGGVGKSTVAIHVALALHRHGAAVGLIDADVLGPSIPGMLGLDTTDPPQATTAGQMIPPQRHGIKAVSMGLLRGDDNPAILRGPMVTKYLQMFIGAVDWGRLDYLILDLPPGTGDTQLTLAQSLPLSGAVIVTTPQDVSLKIARRGLRMFETVQVPVLGIIENMSSFTCPHCGNATDVFSRGGGETMSRQLDVPFLGAIPLDAHIVAAGDAGRPIFDDQPESVAAAAYDTIAVELAHQLDGIPATALRPFAWTWETNEGSPHWPATSPDQPGPPTGPAGLRQRDPRTVTVLWQDGHQHHLDVRDLRLACRCAQCVEEMSGQPLLDPATVRSDVAPRVITSVGNYAITIDWNDGHSTGIYSYEYLRHLGEQTATLVSEDV